VHSRTSSLSSSELLKQLHWLPIEWRIWFKLATLTYKTLHTGRPPYLSNLLQHHEPTRSLHSSSSHYLSVPRHNLKYGYVLFDLPHREFGIHNLLVSVNQSLPTIRRHLKTFYFQSAFLVILFSAVRLPRISSSVRPDSSKDLALYKSFTYLLTKW